MIDCVTPVDDRPRPVLRERVRDTEVIVDSPALANRAMRTRPKRGEPVDLAVEIPLVLDKRSGVTANEIVGKLATRGHRLTADSVCRALRQLAELGKVKKSSRKISGDGKGSSYVWWLA